MSYMQDATRKSLVTATAASSLLGCLIMGELCVQISHITVFVISMQMGRLPPPHFV